MLITMQIRGILWDILFRENGLYEASALSGKIRYSRGHMNLIMAEHSAGKIKSDCHRDVLLPTPSGVVPEFPSASRGFVH